MPDPYSVSHLRYELRTPINHIIGYSELPLAEAEDRQLKPFTSDLKKIHTADKTLFGMISTLFESPTLITSSPSSLPRPARVCPGFAMKTPTEAATAEPEANAVPSCYRGGCGIKGYRVSVAEDGLRALRAVRAEPVDLVLLDVLMPETDGATRRTVAGEDFNRAMLRIWRRLSRQPKTSPECSAGSLRLVESAVKRNDEYRTFEYDC